MSNDEKKTTKQATISIGLYERAEAAVPIVAEHVGFSVTTTQAINYLLGKALYALSAARPTKED